MSKKAMYWDSLFADMAELVTAFDADGEIPSWLDEHGIEQLRAILSQYIPSLIFSLRR